MKKIKTNILVAFLVLCALLLASCNSNSTYTVTFNTLTDATIDPIEATPGEAIFAPESPIREGYRFDGWMLNDAPYSFGVMPEENIELIANWSKYYQISFDSDGGTVIDSMTVAEGDEVVLTAEPKRSHYKFVGWTYMDEPFESETMPSSNIILTANWVPASTITFEVIVYDRYLEEDVTIEMDELVEIEGTQIDAPISPEYPEYEFISWQLDGEDYEFTEMPDHDIVLTAKWTQLSNLPVLFIDLFDSSNQEIQIESITREVYVTSSISLKNTQEDYQIDNEVALFKGRGNGSWVDSGDKKGYRIKFDDKQSILGTTYSRHWVILANANFDDVTMYKNKLAFNMAEELFSNLDYVTSAEWVDVYFNGNYHGVYLVCEHLRVDDDRVDIQSEFGVNDTGYLIEYDAYASGTNGVDYFRVDGMRHPFSMKSPNPDDYFSEGFTVEQYKEQVVFIQEKVAEMVSAALDKDFEKFSEVADVDSFVDIYILHELFKNIDTGYSSFFITREPGGKLHAGPPWDFDATAGSSPSRGNGSPIGIYVGLSVQAFSSRTANELLISLYDTPGFKNVVVSRWQSISPNIQLFIDQTLTDEMVETYRFAMGRNFVRWPSPQGYGPVVSQETAEENWASNIAILKQWMTDRISWLDDEWV